MVSPLVVSTKPVDAESAFKIDDVVVFTWNTALTPSSVGQGTFFVFDPDTLDRVEGEITYSAANKTISFIPRDALLQEHVYKITAVGLDLGMDAWIESIAGDPLLDTVNVTFRTARELYVPLDEVTDRPDVELVGPVRAVEAVLPPQLKAVNFASPDVINLQIVSTVPKTLATEQDPCLTEIKVTLNLPVTDFDPLEDFRLELYPALGDETYLADTDSNGTLWLNDGCAPTGIINGVIPPDFINPTGSVVATGDMLIWTRGTGEPCFMYNQEVHVVLGPGIGGYDGTTTGTLPTETEFVFTTKYWPKFIGVQMVRIVLGSFISRIHDDTINRIIHKNSIDAYEQAGYKFDIDKPYPAVKRYVKWCTIIDVLNSLDLAAVGLGYNQRKLLGDFQFDIGRGNGQGLMNSPLYLQALKGKEKELRELRKYRGQNVPMAVIKGSTAYDARNEIRDRTWDNWIFWGYGGSVYDPGSMSPVANTSEERTSKQLRSHDHHGHNHAAPYGSRHTVAFAPGGSNGLFVCNRNS